MINAWNLYWILQLDQIQTVLIALTIISGILTAISIIFFAIARAICDNFDPDRYFRQEAIEKIISVYESNKVTTSKALKITMTTFLVFLIVTTFVPSSKSAAIMLVLPSIVNNEKIQTEAQELYDIAKNGLKELVEESKVESKEK